MTEVEAKSPAPPVDPQTNPDQNSSLAVDSNNCNNAEAETSHGQPFPPPNFAYYGYPPNQQAPPGDGSNPDPNASPNGNAGGAVPYPPPPPGMMYPYAYPTRLLVRYMPIPMSGMPLPGALLKPKRNKSKWRTACKRCDVARPCERCIKYGLADSCADGQRKERKKGFKRGPYNKRKRQEEREAHEWEATQSNPNGEWTPNEPNGTPFPGPPQQGPFPPPPDGYYPAFYALGPPHSGPGPQLVPAQTGSPDDNPVETQADGAVDPSANTQNGDNSQQPPGPPSFPPPHGQFVYPPLPHGSYPPYGYPFPGPPQQPHQPPQQTPPEAPSSSTKRKPRAEDESKGDDPDQDDPPTPPRKKRKRRNSDGESPGAAKRVSKAKSDKPTSTKRSKRKQLNQQDVGAGDGHNDGNAVTEKNITDHNAEKPVGDPVIQSETP
ncbi:hypothetical protein JB92DRAFT_2987806 [Gautieria morchelliformis]|nr:hypothetical protein JB92DRAFT_2987806 [Gautieria morchelliformis]